MHEVGKKKNTTHETIYKYDCMYAYHGMHPSLVGNED